MRPHGFLPFVLPSVRVMSPEFEFAVVAKKWPVTPHTPSA